MLTMKFQHLKIGQQFEYQGETYVKSGPLVAHHTKTGQQRFIPRYASIVVNDASAPPENKKKRSTLDSSQVLMAFDAFYSSVMDSLQALGPDIESRILESVKHRLTMARHQFLNDVGLQD